MSQNEHGTPKIDAIRSKCLIKLDMCLWNTDIPGSSKVKIWQNLQVLILAMPHPQGHVMLMRCEQLLDELIVHIW